jgi:hypothetical protein
MSSYDDFEAGFGLVMCGRIKEEMSDREIAKRFPGVQYRGSFANGILDALKKDTFRLNLIKSIREPRELED